MITRAEFAEENRRIKKLRSAGKTDHYIKGWLRGWRAVGQHVKNRRGKRQ